MTEGAILVIKVPASSANLGPGFDSVGLALNLYLTLEVERASNWEVVPLSEELKAFPTDETNFIIQTAIEVASLYNKDLPVCRVKVKSDIPLARGLGSSASAIVAGIELADSLCNLKLSKEKKLELSSNIEGHPDNVGASIYGGLIIGCQTKEEVNVEVFHNVKLDIVAVVPKEELLTKASRGVLPEELPFHEAVTAGAVSNLMVASLLSGNYGLAGKMMNKDLYHQPYRQKLVPHLKVIEEHATQFGAFGAALSGAGPTVLMFTKEGSAKSLVEKMNKILPEMSFYCLKIDNLGSQVTIEKVNQKV